MSYHCVMIHKALNKTEIAERYYKAKGKFTTREQAKKNFNLLRRPDIQLIAKIIKEIYRESMETLWKDSIN